MVYMLGCCFFFQAEDGIRDLVRSRGLGDVYKRQATPFACSFMVLSLSRSFWRGWIGPPGVNVSLPRVCLLYTSDAADERSSVDLGGRRILKKKPHKEQQRRATQR